jgi:hypothetical protein
LNGRKTEAIEVKNSIFKRYFDFVIFQEIETRAFHLFRLFLRFFSKNYKQNLHNFNTLESRPLILAPNVYCMVRCGFDKDTICSVALSKNRFAVL